MNGQVYFLCKWVSLSYDESTWELESTILEIDPSKITEYIAKSVIPESKMTNQQEFTRPISTKWKKLDVSPM